MQSIIIATDMSAAAHNATLYAIQAAQITQSNIILFHLYKVPSHVANSRIGTKGIDEMAERMMQRLEAYAEELSKTYKIKINTILRMGSFLETIQNLASEYKSSMLVLGMPKKTFEQDLLGNTTTSAIYSLKIPILSVPETASFYGIKKILYACDLTRGIHAKVLETVKQYATVFQASIEVLYVGDAIKGIKGKTVVNDAFQDIDYVYKNVQSDSVIQTIKKEVDDLQADILIMTPHKYGFWSSILHRSKTRAMASKGNTPLLSLAY